MSRAFRIAFLVFDGCLGARRTSALTAVAIVVTGDELGRELCTWNSVAFVSVASCTVRE